MSNTSITLKDIFGYFVLFFSSNWVITLGLKSILVISSYPSSYNCSLNKELPHPIFIILSVFNKLDDIISLKLGYT